MNEYNYDIELLEHKVDQLEQLFKEFEDAELGSVNERLMALEKDMTDIRRLVAGLRAALHDMGRM